MKTANILFIAFLLFAACSAPKKSTNAPSPTITRDDLLRGGTSFKNAVIIMVEKEGLGLREEYKWLTNNYPGYGLIRKTPAQRSSQHYEIIRIKTKEGHLKDIYFNVTHFWGKP